MAVTSKQESILANIVTTLANINGTGNYNLNIGSRAYREYRHYTDLDSGDFPCCFVMDESDLVFNPLGSGNEYTTGRTRQDVTEGWSIGIVGYVSVKEDPTHAGLLQKECIKLYSDIVVAMLADTKRDGNAQSTILTSASKRVDWKNRVGGVAIVFAIKYDFSPSASTPTT